MPTKPIDITVTCHGPTHLWHPHTNPAREWLAANAEPDSQWYGTALALPAWASHFLGVPAEVDGLTFAEPRA